MKTNIDASAVLILVGLGAAGLVLWKYGPALKGLVTGDNALTKGATNAAGQKVTAYQGAGVLGTLGAATNAASMGYLATAGQWLGSTVYDLTHPADEAPAGRAPTQAENDAAAAATSRWATGGGMSADGAAPSFSDLAGGYGYPLFLEG